MTKVLVERELLERIVSKMNIVWQKTDETEELRALLPAPSVEVEGLEVIGFHCRDSAGIETLEWRGGSYADEPLCSLPKARSVIDQLTVERDAARESMYWRIVALDIVIFTLSPLSIS